MLSGDSWTQCPFIFMCKRMSTLGLWIFSLWWICVLSSFMEMCLSNLWYHACPIDFPYTVNAGVECDEWRMCRCSLRIIFLRAIKFGTHIYNTHLLLCTSNSSPTTACLPKHTILIKVLTIYYETIIFARLHPHPRLLTNLMLGACKRQTFSNKCFWAMIFVHTVFGEACTNFYGTILFALLQFPPDC